MEQGRAGRGHGTTKVCRLMDELPVGLPHDEAAAYRHVSRHALDDTVVQAAFYCPASIILSDRRGFPRRQFAEVLGNA
jgi:hypothetical protein